MRCSLAGAVLLLASATALAQAFPSKPIRIVVPFPPGGGADTLARIMEPKLASIWAQPVIVENRPGASGHIGADFVAKSVPDGSTLLMSSTASLTEKNVDQFAPVSLVSASPYVVAANPKVAAANIRELIAFARANPGKLSFGSSGTGAASHLSAELLKSMAGIDLLHVPYKGTGQAVTDLVAGQVQVMFDVTPTSLPLIKAGKLRPLGVTTTEPLAFLPDVPTIDSFLKGYEASGWIGFGVPRGTPPEIIATLNKQTNAAVLDPTIQQRFADLGALAVPPSSPDEFARFIAENIDKWTKVIKFAGIKPQ